MSNLFTLILIVSILGFSISMMIREKHKGSVCIGCPYSGSKDCHCTCETVAFKDEIDPR